MKVAVYNAQGESLDKEVDLPEGIFGLELKDSHEHVVYLAVKQYLANQRQGTHKSKQRNEIAGSTRKLHKQKGTGGSRKGAITNPLYRGGGRVFGPQPRDYGFKLNRKVKALARKVALSAKAQEGKLVVVEDFTYEQPRTKNYLSFLGNVKVGEKSLAETKSLLLMDFPNKPSKPQAPARPRKLRGAKNRGAFMASMKEYVAQVRAYRQATKAYNEALQEFRTGEAAKYRNVFLSSRNIPNAMVANAKDCHVYQILNADVLVLSESSVQRISEVLGA